MGFIDNLLNKILGTTNGTQFIRNSPKNRTIGETKSILLKHPLFEELHAWSNFHSKVIDIKDPLKRNMAEYYLGLLTQRLYESIYNVVENYNIYINGTIDVNKVLIDTIEVIRSEANQNGVPNIFLDRFTEYLYKQIKILASTFIDVDKFSQFDTPLEIYMHRLDLGLLILRCITSEVEDVINNMNGELHATLEGGKFDK